MDPREWQGRGKGRSRSLEVGDISTGKGGKVKNYRQREDDEPSSTRGHWACMLTAVSVHRNGHCTWRRKGIHEVLAIIVMDTGQAGAGLQRHSRHEHVWSTRLPRLGRPESEQRNFCLF